MQCNGSASWGRDLHSSLEWTPASLTACGLARAADTEMPDLHAPTQEMIGWVPAPQGSKVCHFVIAMQVSDYRCVTVLEKGFCEHLTHSSQTRESSE